MSYTLPQVMLNFYYLFFICCRHTSMRCMSGVCGPAILILKPTILGGIEKVWQLMIHAQGLALETIMSSSYESSIGILGLANIAACAGHDYSNGLDTLKYFKEDVRQN